MGVSPSAGWVRMLEALARAECSVSVSCSLRDNVCEVRPVIASSATVFPESGSTEKLCLVFLRKSNLHRKINHRNVLYLVTSCGSCNKQLNFNWFGFQPSVLQRPVDTCAVTGLRGGEGRGEAWQGDHGFQMISSCLKKRSSKIT